MPRPSWPFDWLKSCVPITTSNGTHSFTRTKTNNCFNSNSYQCSSSLSLCTTISTISSIIKRHHYHHYHHNYINNNQNHYHPHHHHHHHHHSYFYYDQHKVYNKNKVSQLCRSYAIVMILILLFDVTLACGPGRSGGGRRPTRKLTPLVFKQHIPNVSENTLGASGLNEGRITKNSPRFKELVPNYNSDIIFKDEEGTGADRLMTQRLKEKLNTLAISVMNQWPGVKLRVTEGWDEEGHHAIDSLHYEGRAADITTSDKDRSKYGMLARLAVEAGFDWVYYESRFHIHCSVRSEKSESARSGGCFHSKSIVHTRNGPMAISDIRVGDEILAVSSDGELKFSEVLLFLDRDTESERVFYEIETESGSSLLLTPSHLIFVSPDNKTEFSKEISLATYAKNLQPGEFVYVQPDANKFVYVQPDAKKNLQPGEFVYTSSTSHNNFVNHHHHHHQPNHQPNNLIHKNTILDRVVRVTTKVKSGAIAPLTKEGNLVVNNIVASCYAVINDQTIAHWSFAPVRIYNNIKYSIQYLFYLLHITRKESFKRSLPSSHLEKSEGVHWYPKMLYSLAKFFVPTNIMY